MRLQHTLAQGLSVIEGKKSISFVLACECSSHDVFAAWFLFSERFLWNRARLGAIQLRVDEKLKRIAMRSCESVTTVCICTMSKSLPNAEKE